MPFVLRPYQEAALGAARQALSDGMSRPLVCLPTGSGKSPVIAALLKAVYDADPTEKLLCCVHTQELIGQLAETYQSYTAQAPSIYSASLRKRQIGSVGFAQIQSVFKRSLEFGRVKLLVIDECDRMPRDGAGQYKTFIEGLLVQNPDLRIVGFTATPYRMGSGLVYGEGQQFTDMVFDAPIKELIRDGFLSQLRSKDGGAVDLSSVHVRQGEYVQSELELVMSDERVVERACDEILKYGADRRAMLLFCSGVKHAALVSEAMQRRGIEAPIVEGNTGDDERKKLIARFRAKDLRALVNINVLSVGFDAPHVDLIALLRPTKSPGLYYQQIGRGLRRAEGKEDCLVLDLAGNIAEHGPIDSLNDRIKRTKSAKEKGKAPQKTCPQCNEIIPAQAMTCIRCGFKFAPPPVAKHDVHASDDSPLSSSKAETAQVKSVSYRVHTPKDPSKQPTVRVDYRIGLMTHSEWLSVDAKAHPYARNKALLSLMQTPIKPDSERTIRVQNGRVYGIYQGQETLLETALALVPWLACLQAPSTIQLQTDPANPRYKRITGRTFATEAMHAQ